MNGPQTTSRANPELSLVIQQIMDLSATNLDHEEVGMNSKGQLVTHGSLQTLQQPTFAGRMVNVFYAPVTETFADCQKNLQQYFKIQQQQKKLAYRQIEENNLQRDNAPTIGGAYELSILLSTAETIPFKGGAGIYNCPENNTRVEEAPRLRAGDMNILQRFVIAQLGSQTTNAITSDPEAKEMIISFYKQDENAVVKLFEYLSTHDMNNPTQNKKASAQLENLLRGYWTNKSKPKTVQSSVAAPPVNDMMPDAPFSQQSRQKASDSMRTLVSQAKSEKAKGNLLNAFEKFRFIVETCHREDNSNRYDTAVRSMYEIKSEPNSPVTEQHYPAQHLIKHLRALQQNGDAFAGQYIEILLVNQNTAPLQASNPGTYRKENPQPVMPLVVPRKTNNSEKTFIPIAPMQSNAQSYTYEIQKTERGVTKTYQRKADARQKKISELYPIEQGGFDAYTQLIKNENIPEQTFDNLEYRIEDNYQIVQQKIAKANQAAEQQRQQQNPAEGRCQQFSTQTMQAAEVFHTIDGASSEPIAQLPAAGAACATARRDSMDDEHVVTQFSFKAGDTSIPVTIAGVFDGHSGHYFASGRAPATRCARLVADTLKSRLEEYNHGTLTQAGIWNALKLTTVDLDRAGQSLDAGTTACVVLMIQGHLWVVNVGDSRAMLALDNGKCIQLSEDAKSTDENYQSSVIKRGGNIANDRVYSPRGRGWMATPRSIGDHTLRGSISSRGKVTCCSVTDEIKRARLVVGCDGIFDVATSDQVAQLVHHVTTTHPKISNEAVATEILSHAYQAGSSDNLSVVVVPVASMTESA